LGGQLLSRQRRGRLYRIHLADQHPAGPWKSEHGHRGRRGAGSGPGDHLCADRARGASRVTQHASLTPERWARFTPDQQVLMVANEMNRASSLLGDADLSSLRRTYERVLRLVDLTVVTQTRRGLRRDLLRWRDLVAALHIAPRADAPHTPRPSGACCDSRQWPRTRSRTSCRDASPADSAGL
jgi:hypothetical protein